MRRLNGKMLMMLIALLLSAYLPAAANPLSGVWTVNPADYRYDMSLYFNVNLKESESIDSFEIGAFVGDECRGIAELLDLPENGGCRYMRIRSNSSAGEQEKIVFKIRNKSTGETVEIAGNENEPFVFVPDGMVGLPSDPYMMSRYYEVNVLASENGNVEFNSGKYPENSSLNIEAVPAEGYHFVKWSDGVTDAQRTLVVTGDMELTAYFAVSTYKAVFVIDDQEIGTLEFEYGSVITAPEAPAREGYTFAGWGEIPETMPAKDIEVTGSYTVNSYKAVFKIGEEVVATLDVEYGSSITAPDAPAREGYTFAGWGEMPETMPAKDIEVTGSYTVNSYTLTVYLDGEVYMVEEIEYGAKIEIPTPDVPGNKVFDGWKEEIPEYMPANDLEIHGTTSDDMSSVNNAIVTDGNRVTVYSLRGTLLYKDANAEEVMPRLAPGLYIINGKKVMVK